MPASPRVDARSPPPPTLAPLCFVQAGNEAVLRARFEDAQFFYSNDLTTPLRDAR